MNQAQVIAVAVEQAVRAAMAAGNGKAPKAKGRPVVKADDNAKAAYAAKVAAIFAKKGYTNTVLWTDISVYGKPADGDKPATGWLALGRKVKPGEKSTKVPFERGGRGFSLFHVDQTSPIQ